MSYLSPSGVARAFPGGRLPHQEGQNEDKNEERLREKTKKMEIEENEESGTLTHPGL